MDNEANFDIKVQHALQDIIHTKVNYQVTGGKRKKTILERSLQHASKNKGFMANYSRKLPKKERISKKEINKIISKEEDKKYHKQYQRPVNKRSYGILDVEAVIHSIYNKQFLIIIEDKKDYHDMIVPGTKDHELLDLNAYNTINKAVNGAVYYAKCIQSYERKRNGSNIQYPLIFAIGCTPSKDGDNRKFYIDPYFVKNYKDKSIVIHTSKMSPINGTAEQCFSFLKNSNIDYYYKNNVNNIKSQKEIVEPDIDSIADRLNNYMETLQLESNDKAPLIAAILLGMEGYNKEYGEKNPEKMANSLIGDTDDTDGKKVYRYIERYLRSRVKESTFKPQEAKTVKDSFEFITKKQSVLNKPKGNIINKQYNIIPFTPLHCIANILTPIYNYMRISRKRDSTNAQNDILGHFYSKFVKYNNNDGNSLGMVITPVRMTDIMVLLAKIQSSDHILDPVAGTGTFLISAMQYMIHQCTDKNGHIDRNTYNKIMNNCLYGIEKRSDMFSIAVSNLILRGDGNSNFRNADFFECYSKYTQNQDKLQKKYVDKLYRLTKTKLDNYKSILNKNKLSNRSQALKGVIKKIRHYRNKCNQLSDNVRDLNNILKGYKHGIPISSPNKILMNPPYSLTKKAHGKPEIDFIVHALKIIKPGGILAAIVPKSIFTATGNGGSQEHLEQQKYWILHNCVVKSVITMNPKVFYPVGTQPIIVIIKKSTGSNTDNKLTNLIDFTHDGYKLITKKGVKRQVTKKTRDNLLCQLLQSNDQEYGSDPLIKSDVKCIRAKLFASKHDEDLYIKKNNKSTLPSYMTYEWLFNSVYTVPGHPTEKDFQKTVSNYLIFRIKSQLRGHGKLFSNIKISNNEDKSCNLNLDKKKWKSFRIKDIISYYHRGQNYPKVDRHTGSIPYVSRKSTNNGVDDFISSSSRSMAKYTNVISVNSGGSAGYAFYHPYTAYFGNTLNVLVFNNLNMYKALFITTCIMQQKSNFDYGYELYSQRLLDLKINLPENSNSMPDYNFMCMYIKRIVNKCYTLIDR